MISLAEAIKFGIGYLILILFYFYVITQLTTPNILETFIIFFGYPAVAYYLIVQDKSLNLFKFVIILFIFLIAKIITPIFIAFEQTQNFFGNLLAIFELFPAILLVGGLIWASEITKEKQEIYSELIQWR